MKILILALSLAVVSSCGIKGDPLPPAEQQTIQTAQDLTPAPPVNPQVKDASEKPPVKKKK